MRAIQRVTGRKILSLVPADDVVVITSMGADEDAGSMAAVQTDAQQQTKNKIIKKRATTQKRVHASCGRKRGNEGSQCR